MASQLLQAFDYNTTAAVLQHDPLIMNTPEPAGQRGRWFKGQG